MTRQLLLVCVEALKDALVRQPSHIVVTARIVRQYSRPSDSMRQLKRMLNRSQVFLNCPSQSDKAVIKI